MMIRRAKRLAIDFFKDIKDSYLKPKDSVSARKGKQRERRSTDGIELDETTPATPSRLHNSNERHFRIKRKSKRRSKDTNSLPLPLNKRPSWYDLRYRSGTDPASPPLSSSKGFKSKLKNRTQSLQVLSDDTDKISRVIIRESDAEVAGIVNSYYDSSGRSSIGGSSDSSDITEYIAVKLRVPIQNELNNAADSPVNSESPSSHPLASSRESKEKAEKTIDEYNKEIFGIYDAMMQREIDELCARLEEQKRELLAEIALRQSQTPPLVSALRSSLVLLPSIKSESTIVEDEKTEESKLPNRGRRSSAVMFDDRVVVRELDGNGVERTTLTATLSDFQRPRPKMRNRFSRRAIRSSPLFNTNNKPSPLPLASSPLRHSAEALLPSISPPSSPLSSPISSPVQSPASSPLNSPTTRSPTSSPSNSPSPSPATSPTTASRFGHAWMRSRMPTRAVTPPLLTRSESRIRDNEETNNSGGEEEEIASVILKYEQEKLSLLDEIELREIQEACKELDEERQLLLKEIAYRNELREAATRARIERRQAVKLRNTKVKSGIIKFDREMDRGEHDKLARKIMFDSGWRKKSSIRGNRPKFKSCVEKRKKD